MEGDEQLDRFSARRLPIQEGRCVRGWALVLPVLNAVDSDLAKAVRAAILSGVFFECLRVGQDVALLMG